MAGATARRSVEQGVRELDWAVSQGEESLRHQEAQLADARQQIAGFEATIKHEHGPPPATRPS